MAYQFDRERSASFKFKNQNATSITLRGINPTIDSAAVICDGVSSLIAIGGLQGRYIDAERTVKDNVYNDED